MWEKQQLIGGHKSQLNAVTKMALIESDHEKIGTSFRPHLELGTNWKRPADVPLFYLPKDFIHHFPSRKMPLG